MKKEKTVEYFIVELDLAAINDLSDIIEIGDIDIPISAKNNGEAKKLFAKYLASRSEQLQQKRFATVGQNRNPRLEKRIIIKEIIT